MLYLWLPAVTLLSFLHVAIATLLATVEHLDLGHVVQTHANTFLQTGSQVLLAACAEHGWEWIPTRRTRNNVDWNKGMREMIFCLRRRKKSCIMCVFTVHKAK